MQHKNEKEYSDSASTLENQLEKNFDTHLEITKSHCTENGNYEIGEHMNRIETNITMASMVELPKADDAFYDTIPDGGYGWVVAISGFLVNFIMFGTSAIWGVFTDAFATTILKNKATTMELVGVGAVMEVTLNLFSPIGPLIAPMGAQLTLALGAILMSLGIILSSFIKEVWQLYITMGLVFGIGTSIVYVSVVSVIPQWFSTRRGTAMGICSAGSGVGGLALSPMVDSLVNKYGLPWALRIVGLMAFGICVTAAFFIRTRLPPNSKEKTTRLPIRFNLLKDINFLIMIAGLVISLTGFLIPLIYLPTYAREFGVTSSQASTLVGVVCAMNAIGRLVLGFIADKIGRINMFFIASTSAGILCMVLWPFAKTFETMMAYSVLFGFTCGIYFPLSAPITATVVGMDNIASGLSLMFVMSSISGIGPPVAAAIQLVTPNDGYIGIQMFSGSLYITGGIICMYLKFRLTGSLFSIL